MTKMTEAEFVSCHRVAPWGSSADRIRRAEELLQTAPMDADERSVYDASKHLSLAGYLKTVVAHRESEAAGMRADLDACSWLRPLRRKRIAAGIAARESSADYARERLSVVEKGA